MAKNLMDAVQSFRFHTFHIPRYMREEVVNYIKSGEVPGDFLKAVLTNDLKNSVLKGNKTQIENLPVFIHFLQENAPKDCWGSKTAVSKWIATPKGDKE